MKTKKTIFRKIWAGIVILIFLLPLFCSFLLFFNTKINVLVKSEKTADNKILVYIDKIQYSAIQDIITRIFQVPLKLTRYRVCFKNNTTAIEQDNITALLAKKLILETTNGESTGVEPFDIAPNGKECREINLDKIIIGEATYEYHPKYFPSTFDIKFDISADDEAYLSSMDKWIMAIIFVIAFYGLLILIKSIKDVIVSKIKMFFKK